MSATTVSTSTGLAVLFETFCPTNIRSAMPTADTRALSLNRLMQFERSVDIARSRACGSTTFVICVNLKNPKTTQTTNKTQPKNQKDTQKNTPKIAPMY